QRCARIGLVDRGWTTAAGAAIGRHVAAQRGARRAGRGNRSSPAPARRAEERRQGAHGSAASGGPYHRGDEGGRGGLATPCSAPVLVLQPGGVEFRNRKPTAIGRLRAAVPTALTVRSESHDLRRRDGARGFAGGCAVAIRTGVAIFMPWRHGRKDATGEADDLGKRGQTFANDRGGARDSRGGRRHLCGLPKL